MMNFASHFRWIGVTIYLCFCTQAFAQPSHTVVADLPGMFCGWCANEGVWQWKDEIVVGFVAKAFEDRGDSVDGHNAVSGAPEYHYLARSRDGGRHWSLEPASWFDAAATQEGGVMPYDQFAQGKGMPLGHRHFALRCRDNLFWYSRDKGKHWTGSIAFPRFDSEITARTEYHVTGDSCYIFLSAKNRRQDRAFTVLATDRGRSMQNLGWIAPVHADSLAEAEWSEVSGDEPIPSGHTVRSVMPSGAMLANGQYLTSLRRKISLGNDRHKNWIACYASEDSCRTWQYASFVAETDSGTRNGNPPAMAVSESGRVVVCYGQRSAPYGIYYRVSDDGGMTWGEPRALRTDGRSWDVGYPRLVCVGGETFVALYYIATPAQRRQRIEATRFTLE